MPVDTGVERWRIRTTAGRERAIRIYSHETHAAALCAWLGAAIARRREEP